MPGYRLLFHPFLLDLSLLVLKGVACLGCSKFKATAVTAIVDEEEA